MTELKSLASLATFTNGRAFKPSDFTPDGLPVVRIKQLLNPGVEFDLFNGTVDPKHRIENGDLIFSWSATLACVRWNRGPAVLNQHLFKVEEFDGIDRTWLGYAIESVIPALNSATHGTTMKHITKSELETTMVPVPPIEEQRRIARTIGVSDAVVDRAEETLVASRSLRRSIAHSRLQGAGTSGWHVRELPELAEVLDSQRVPINSRDRALRVGDVPYYGAAGQVGFIDEPLFNEELVLLGEDAVPFLDPNGVKAYVVDGPSWVNNHAHVLRTNPEVPALVFAELLNQFDYSGKVGGGTRLKLTQKEMRRMRLPVPPSDVAEQINGELKAVDEVIEMSSLELQSLTTFRQALLSKLLAPTVAPAPAAALSEAIAA